MNTQLQYSPMVVGANSTATITGKAIGGFLCQTSGNITISRTTVNGIMSIVNGFPVTAGQWVDIPLFLSSNGGTITTAGGASGTLGVA